MSLTIILKGAEMYIYILRCCDDTLYTGIAADIKKRIRQHMGIIKGGAKYTHSHGIKYIAALWETDDTSAARKLEYALKTLTKKQKESLVICQEMLTEKYCTQLSCFYFSCAYDMKDNINKYLEENNKIHNCK